MSNALVPVGDLERMAKAITASKLFGVQNVEQALALMLVAQAEGLHPATAARDYHIIQGRPTLKADAMLARYLNSGGKVEWHDHTDQKVSATFTHPAGGSLRIEWDFARAKQAGLGSKDMWIKYPRQMLRARVISEGIRATNPGIAPGIYTPEEAQDFDADRAPKRKEKDMGAAQVVDPETGEVTEIPAARPIAPSAIPSNSPEGGTAAAGTFDKDDPYALALQSSETVEELRDVWKGVPKAKQAALLAVKDARKAQLEAA